MKNKIKIQLFSGFLLILLGLLLFYNYAYQKDKEATASNKWVVQSYAILNEVSRFGEYISAAETSQRGFIITQKLEFLTLYKSSIDSSRYALKNLKELTKFHRDKDVIETLSQLTNERIKIMELVIKEREFGLDEPNNLVLILHGNKTMKKIRGLVSTLRSGEQELLMQRIRENERKQASSANSIFISMWVAFGILFIGFLIIYRNLNIRRKIEDNLREVSNQIQDLYNNAPCGYYLLDKEANVYDVNETLLGWTGYSKSDLNHTPIRSSLLKNYSDERFDIAFQKFILLGEVKDSELEFKRKDGSLFSVLINGKAIYDSSGNFINSRFAVIDNTARKNLQQERDSFYTYSNEMMIVTRDDGRIVSSNPVFEKTLGYSKDQLKGLNISRLIHPDDLAKTLSAKEQHGNSGEPMLSYENRIKSKNGNFHWVLWNSVNFPNQKLTYSYGRNITERKLSEEKLTAVNNELGSFTYSVSHDLRSPLRFIQSYAKILQDQYQPQLDDEANRIVEVIIRNAGKMANLINDLLEFSKMGTKDVFLGTYSMQRLVEDVMKESKDLEPERIINVTIHQLPDVTSDSNMIRQVWINLISNAIKYSRKKDHTEIEIGAETKDGIVTYFIKDNGTGFDMTYAHKLFGVFHRLHSSAEFEGTGVGLALVKRIVSRHHGTIWVEAVKDIGCAFYFTLPLEKSITPEI